MSAILDPIRSAIPAGARQRYYDVVTALVGALALWGYLSVSNTQLWLAVGINVVSLLFAVLYATSTVRQAFYAVLAAASAVAGSYGILNDVKWAAVLSLVAAILGTAVAGSNTPVIEAKQVGPDTFAA